MDLPLSISAISWVLGVIGGLLAFYVLLSQQRSMEKGIHYIHDDILTMPRPSEFLSLDKSSKELKNELLEMKKPKLFYYFDKNIVMSLHNQIQESLKPKSIEKETIGKKGKEIGFNKVIIASSEKGESKRLLEKFTITESIETAYNDLERYLIRNNQITFGLEYFDYDHSIENDFFRICDKIKKDFDFEIPQTVKEDFVEKK